MCVNTSSDAFHYEQSLKEAKLIFEESAAETNKEARSIYSMINTLRSRYPHNEIYKSLYRQRGHLSDRQKSLIRKLHNEAFV